MAKGGGRSGVRGDARPLLDLIKRAKRVASGELAEKSARTFGETVYGLNRATLGAGTSPTGRKWEPRADGRPALANVRVGMLGVAYWRGGFKLQLPEPYRYHQGGAYRPPKVEGGKGWRIPKRPMLLGRGRALPKKWRIPVMRELDALWYGTMKG